ncbi:MAG: cell division protein FtsQ/DivIB [Mangrovibacterium sp.]
MVRRVIKIMAMAFVVVGLISAQLITNRRIGRLKYNLLKIEIPEGTPRYIDEQGVQKLVEEYLPDLNMECVDSLDLNDLETYMESITAIKNAEVFNKISGENLNFTTQLVVRVHQREPIVRVITTNDNYYMDNDGVRIDANYSYSAKVPLLTGSVSEEYMRNDILPLIRYINTNDFWSAQIKDIKVDEDGELCMVPLIGSQTIQFGTPVRYKEKLRNLLALYEQGFNKLGWDKYKTIDLKYKGQVVCVSK